MSRTPQEAARIDYRRSQVAELYLQRTPQALIAQKLGVAQSTVSLDLKVIRKSWKESAIRDFEESCGIELARIDKLEREAWSAWEASKKPTEATRLVNDGKNKRAEKTSRQTAGDARFLDIVHKCIAARRTLLGLDAPTRIAPTSPSGDESYHAHVMKELMRLAEQAHGGAQIIDADFVESAYQELIAEKS